MRDPKEHLSLREASDALGISEVSARRWIKSGKLKAYQPGRKYLVPVSAVEELLEITKPPKAPAPLPLEFGEQHGASEQPEDDGLGAKEWERRRSKITGLTLEATELRKIWAKELQGGGLAEHRAMEISFAITGVLESAQSPTILGGLERTDKTNAKQVKRLREELERLVGLLRLSVKQVTTGIEFKSIIDGVVFEQGSASPVEPAKRIHA